MIEKINEGLFIPLDLTWKVCAIIILIAIMAIVAYSICGAIENEWMNAHGYWNNDSTEWHKNKPQMERP